MVKFSIIITSFNYENYIIECVNSCLNQVNFSDYEIIVVDDGSTDNTDLLLSKYSDNKLSVYSLENSGIEKAANFGISKSQGSFIVRVDADDKFSETFLQEINREIENSSYDFYYSNYSIIDSESNIIENVILPQFNNEEIFSRGDFLATGTVFKREVLYKIGLYNTTVKNSGLENFELILKMLLNNNKGKLIAKSLFCYRRHQKNMSDIRRSKIIAFGNDLFNKFCLGKYRTNSNHPYKLKLS